MTEHEYFDRGKQLLNRIVNQRKWLINHNKSKLPADFTKQELINIDYALSIIKNGSGMKAYIHRKKETINILISAVNRKYHNELHSLIKTDFN